MTQDNHLYIPMIGKLGSDFKAAAHAQKTIVLVEALQEATSTDAQTRT